MKDMKVDGRSNQPGSRTGQRPGDIEAPPCPVTADPLGIGAELLEQAIVILKRAHLAFTAALKYPELDGETSPGCCS